MTKQAFCYADRNRRRIKSKKLADVLLHTGDYDNPRMRSVFRDFERAKKAAAGAANLT